MDNQHCMADRWQENNTVPKVIAFYLPQYHEIPENNKWWGKGFTEWTNVKRAKKLFDGQYQPQVPLNNNYYNLLDKKIVEWQTDLANKYGVYGFCYYHYDFGGKRLLEKPAENLLRWKDINQRFCFAWANVTWARTWKNVPGASLTKWSPDEDNNENNEEAGILIEQQYGDPKQWKEHFDYLLPFFDDNRYIKKEGKPVFLIYHLDAIPFAKEMFKLWSDLAQQNGLCGIHFVAMNPSEVRNEYIEAVAQCYISSALSRSVKARSVQYGRAIVNKIMGFLHIPCRLANIWDYEFVWKAMTGMAPFEKGITYAGAFVNQDDTPRNGRLGTFLKNSSPDIFRKYMEIQLKRARDKYQSEYVFLDAWNEWGEGNHLEPDEKDGYAYLEALAQSIDAAGRG